MKATDSTKKLFENPILERLSRSSAPRVITALYLLAFGIFLWGFPDSSNPLNGKLLWLLVGLIAFSLAEYLIHRFVFHFGDYRNEKKWQAKIHGIHHDFPSDKDRLALPIPVALGVSLLLFLVLKWIMGDLAFAFFPGFLVGYATYLCVHFLIHTRKPPKNYLRALWRNHHIHHHVDERKSFGVTSPFWDWVFQTLPKKPT